LFVENVSENSRVEIMHDGKAIASKIFRHVIFDGKNSLSYIGSFYGSSVHCIKGFIHTWILTTDLDYVGDNDSIDYIPECSTNEYINEFGACDV